MKDLKSLRESINAKESINESISQKNATNAYEMTLISMNQEIKLSLF